MRKTTVRNAFAAAGTYYVFAMWVAPVVLMAFAPITNRLFFTGAFAIAVVMPLVTGLPMALVAGATGAATGLVVDSRHGLRWAFLPATLYAVSSLVGYHWVRPPQFGDRVAQVLQAAEPAVACLLGAALVEMGKRMQPRARERAGQQGDAVAEARKEDGQ
jgi:hypothetical protein